MYTKVKNLINNNSSLVGLKQVTKGIIEEKVWCVILSTDCDDFIKAQIETAMRGKSELLIEYTDSKEELGKLAGIDVPAAVVGLVKESQKVQDAQMSNPKG